MSGSVKIIYKNWGFRLLACFQILMYGYASASWTDDSHITITQETPPAEEGGSPAVPH